MCNVWHCVTISLVQSCSRTGTINFIFDTLHLFVHITSHLICRPFDLMHITYIHIHKQIHWVNKTRSVLSRVIKGTTDILGFTPQKATEPQSRTRWICRRNRWSPTLHRAFCFSFGRHSTWSQFNSVYFIKPNITNYEFASEGFTLCTYTTSLTFDLTSDQEKRPWNRKKTFHMEWKGRSL